MFTQLKTALVVQCRLGSRRLPRKALRRALGKTLIQHVCDRITCIKLPVVLAVPEGEAKDFAFLQKLYSKPSLSFFEGPEDDVLSRLFHAAKHHKLQTLVRVTADNPFTSRTCIRRLLELHETAQADLSFFEGLPYGAGVEVVGAECLERMHGLASEAVEREHPTQFAYRNPKLFSIQGLSAPPRYRHPEIRVTVDTNEDWVRFNNWLAKLSPKEASGTKPIPLLKVIEYELSLSSGSNRLPEGRSSALLGNGLLGDEEEANHHHDERNANNPNR